MRHIELSELLKTIFADENGKRAKKTLKKAHVRAARCSDASQRSRYIKNNGSEKWRLLKEMLADRIGNKCWYTEVELTGAPLHVDHFRPVEKYWWLAFEAENYRLACHWSNSERENSLYGRSGGKSNHFPLIDEAHRAKGKKGIRIEKPIILDPCDPNDCKLIAFQADGRPVINPTYETDPIAKRRVEESKILLNLDHPDFNSKREQLRNEIQSDVQVYEALHPNSSERDLIRDRLAARIEPDAPFSTAARYYLQHHRYLDWVEEILNRRKCSQTTTSDRHQ